MRIAYLFALTLAAASATACTDETSTDELSFEGDADEAGKADAATLDLVPLDNVNVSSSRRQKGGTFVMTSKQSWYRTMGTASPANVDFSKEWVVFYGMGQRNSGGYSAEVTELSYDANDRALIVSTVGTSPGYDCALAQIITTPYQVAKFRIPAPRPLYALADHSDEVRNCTAPRELLSYRYGSQITGSDLTIMDDGSINHDEHRTATDVEHIDHAKLSAADLAELRGWIADAKTGTLVTSDGGATTFGSASGFLRTYLPDGSEVVIDLDLRDEDGDGLNDRTRNTSAAAASIRGLILDMVDHDL